jgi:photosystem II stability/assembly factor-like uncharacterized protein
MMTDPKSGALIAFGGHGSGFPSKFPSALLRSEDAGVTWQVLATGTNGELRAGLIEPGSNNMVIVGQKGVILRSEDSGKTWQTLPSHTSQHFRDAAFDPDNGTLVAVGERIVQLVRQQQK